jgi:AraC-like DNA-binding protein
MIELGRIALTPDIQAGNAVYDEKIVQILSWINDNLLNEISVNSLAANFFVSKYHMMRRFRAETGYSIHSYIINKRLLTARDMLIGGAGATEACFGCGYKDYSSFARAYKKQFGVTPSETVKNNKRS